MVEIHRDEGEIARDIATTEAVIELDAVEDPNFAIFEADVAGVQVAVPLTNPTLPHSTLQQSTITIQERQLPGFEKSDPGAPRVGVEAGSVRRVLAQLAEVLLDVVEDRAARTELIDTGSGRSIVVKAYELGNQRVHHPIVDLSSFENRFQHRARR